MAVAVVLRADAVRTLAAASVLAGYTAIGTPLDSPGRIYFIQNLTDALLMFSYDGVNDHFPLPSNGFKIEDVCANQISGAPGFFIAVGTQFYVKQVGVPTTGSVYLSVEHARGE